MSNILCISIQFYSENSLFFRELFFEKAKYSNLAFFYQTDRKWKPTEQF